MFLSQNSGKWALANVLPLFNNASLVFFSNFDAAANVPERAVQASQTALCTFTFTANAFGTLAFSSNNEQATASFAATSVTPGANGTVTWARARLNSIPWTVSATYAASLQWQVVSVSGNFYVLTRTGTASSTGPTATSTTPIADGGVEWMYFGTTATQNDVLADFSVGTSASDIIIGSTSITTSVQVTMTSFVLQTASY
jgi:hypothetical protein